MTFLWIRNGSEGALPTRMVTKLWASGELFLGVSQRSESDEYLDRQEYVDSLEVERLFGIKGGSLG